MTAQGHPCTSCSVCTNLAPDRQKTRQEGGRWQKHVDKEVFPSSSLHQFSYVCVQPPRLCVTYVFMFALSLTIRLISTSCLSSHSPVHAKQVGLGDIVVTRRGQLVNCCGMAQHASSSRQQQLPEPPQFSLYCSVLFHLAFCLQLYTILFKKQKFFRRKNTALQASQLC